MLKIAHVIATFPPHLGGMGTVALDECRTLAGHGYEVAVFTLRYPGFNYNDKQWPFKVVRLRPIFKFGDAGWVPQLAKYLRGFDVVHLHYPFYGGAEWVTLAKIFNKQKYVVTYHMDAAPVGWVKRAAQDVYDRLFARAILRGAEKVIAVDKEHFLQSQYVILSETKNPLATREGSFAPLRMTIGGDTLPSKVIEIPNAVDTEIFKPRAVNLAELGLQEFEGKKIILFVGNLMPVKRLDLLLEAVRGLNDVRLVVVGGGYEEGRYRRMAAEPALTLRPSPAGRGEVDFFSPREKAGMRDSIRFVGPVDDRVKLSMYYNIATCLAVPSDAESFSLVIAEAMACGCPVVASDITGIRERVSVGRDGFLFTPGSVESLREQLDKIVKLSVEERKAMGERGREKVVEKYDLEMHVSKLEKVYQSLHS